MAAIATLTVALTVCTALADETRVDLTLASALGIDVNDRCERSASDVHACSPALAYPTAELAVEVRPIAWLGLGAFTGLSHQRANEEETRDGVRLSGDDDWMLRVGGELKWHPFVSALPGAWLGASAGLAKLYGSSEQRGALIGGSSGVDWTLYERLVLGVGARVEYLALGSPDTIGRGLSIGDARYASGVRVWVGARLGVTF